MSNLRLKNNTWDAANVYDATLGKTQEQINALNLPKTGGTMSGAIAMGSNKITGLADGESDQDAATIQQLNTKADESDLLKAFATGTASGSIASFSDGADGMPVKSLTVNIEPAQADSGDPSPENVRPISGWTGCNIHVSPTTTGGTVYPITFPASAGTVYGGTLDVATGELTVGALYCETNSAGKLVPYLPGMEFDPIGCTTASGYAYFGIPIGVNAFAEDSAQCCNRYGIEFGGSGVAENDNNCRIRKTTNFNRLTFKQTSIPGWGTEGFSGSDVESYFAENPLQVIIPLTAPITIQLNAVPVVKTLLGQNRIWADCGSVSVEYAAETSFYRGFDIYPTGDDTDRTAEIRNILSKTRVCRFAPGVFYFSHFLCGGVLDGAGTEKTQLIFKDESNPWYAIRFNSTTPREVIKNLTIEAYREGGGNLDTPAEDYSLGVHGIALGHNSKTNESDLEVTEVSIENVTIRNFSGCGVFVRHTTQNTNGSSFRNVRVEHCSAGFYFGNHAEYNIIANCYANWCYTGIIVMGGNNVVSGCFFAQNQINLKLLESDAYSQATGNDAHGLFSGCKFTHAGYLSEKYPADYPDAPVYDIFGTAQASAELIIGCYIGYPVYIQNRGQPLMISGCEIREKCTVTADNSKIALMGCMIEDGNFTPVTLNGGVVKMSNCLNYQLGAIGN